MSTPSPKYICWFENDFMADRVVIRMTPHHRLMYRALCQVARYIETRPYLPDDDNELYLLADADSLEQWKANREAVLVKFSRVTIDGKPMLAQKRVLKEAAKYDEFVESRSKAGKASAEARSTRVQQESTGVEHASTDGQQSKGKGNANTTVLDPSQPKACTSTLTDSITSQNSLPTTHHSELSVCSEFSVPEEGYKWDAPVMLAWVFGEYIVRTNPRRKELKIPAANVRPRHWKDSWAGDFKRLLQAGYSQDDILKMMKVVFASDRWLPYVVRPLGFVKQVEMIASDLHIKIHEVEPAVTSAERRAISGKARESRDREEYDQHITDEGYENREAQRLASVAPDDMTELGDLENL
jgi:uncharacterized protein YdaU (DUF1376 family)